MSKEMEEREYRINLARRMGKDNLETAEKIYSLFAEAREYDEIIQYVRGAYRRWVEKMYFAPRGPQFDGVDEQILKDLSDGFSKTLENLSRIGEILDPVLYYDLFVKQESEEPEWQAMNLHDWVAKYMMPTSVSRGKTQE